MAASRATRGWRVSSVVARHPVIAFIAIAYGFSWSLWALGAVAPGAAPILDPAATFGPAVGAMVLIASRSAPGARRRALGGLLLRVVRPRAGAGWYVLALVLFPAVSILGIGILGLLGAPVNIPLLGSDPATIAAQVVTVFVTTAVLGGPLGEEIGWRGYLLPTLQRRWSPLVSSAVVGVVWGMWHLPLHLRGLYDGTMGDGWAGIGLRLLSSMSLAVLFTWLFNRGRGDLLLMIVFHTSVNNTSGFWLPVHAGVQLVLVPLLIVLVLVDGMHRPLPPGDADGPPDPRREP